MKGVGIEGGGNNSPCHRVGGVHVSKLDDRWSTDWDTLLQQHRGWLIVVYVIWFPLNLLNILRSLKPLTVDLIDQHSLHTRFLPSDPLGHRIHITPEPEVTLWVVLRLE